MRKLVEYGWDKTFGTLDRWMDRNYIGTGELLVLGCIAAVVMIFAVAIIKSATAPPPTDRENYPEYYDGLDKVKKACGLQSKDAKAYKLLVNKDWDSIRIEEISTGISEKCIDYRLPKVAW